MGLGCSINRPGFNNVTAPQNILPWSWISPSAVANPGPEMTGLHDCRWFSWHLVSAVCVGSSRAMVFLADPARASCWIRSLCFVKWIAGAVVVFVVV